MAAGQLTLVRGDTVPLSFTAQPVNGVILSGQDASAYTAFYFTIKRSSSDADPGLLQLTGSDISLTNPAASTAAIWTVTIPSSALSQAAGMPDWDYLVYWDLKGKDASGNDFTLESGTLLVQGSKNMTRAG